MVLHFPVLLLDQNVSNCPFQTVSCSIDFIGVASFNEALELREAGVSIPILLFGLPFPEEVPGIIANDISSVVADESLVDIFIHSARAAGLQARLHINIDTGMGRIGVLPENVVKLVTPSPPPPPPFTNSLMFLCRPGSEDCRKWACCIRRDHDTFPSC